MTKLNLSKEELIRLHSILDFREHINRVKKSKPNWSIPLQPYTYFEDLAKLNIERNPEWYYNEDMLAYRISGDYEFRWNPNYMRKARTIMKKLHFIFNK